MTAGAAAVPADRATRTRASENSDRVGDCEGGPAPGEREVRAPPGGGPSRDPLPPAQAAHAGARRGQTRVRARKAAAGVRRRRPRRPGSSRPPPSAGAARRRTGAGRDGRRAPARAGRTPACPFERHAGRTRRPRGSAPHRRGPAACPGPPRGAPSARAARAAPRGSDGSGTGSPRRARGPPRGPLSARHGAGERQIAGAAGRPARPRDSPR